MKKEAMEVLLNRRAIRKFKPDAIPADVLDAVLEAGTFAPTGSGRQSPVILVVQDEEKVNKVKKLNAKVMGTDRDPYYGAPVILLVLATERAVNEEIAILDSASVTVNLLNAAYAMGLGSCWIHRAKQTFETEEGKALLRKWGLKENLVGIGNFILGYADESPEAKPRLDGRIVKIG